MQSDNIVQLKDITKVFDDSVVAVNQVSLQVHKGEFLTLLGPSGCGKTTTLRMIGGLEVATSGSIVIDGMDITYVPPYQRNTSMMFQDYALFPHMSIEDNIAFGLKMRGVSRKERIKKAHEMLEFIQLPQIARRKPNQLSGGQRQRVALVRSLILQPAVLLLDEPLGALDAELRRQMQVELKRNQRQLGITFIYVTHDQEEALSMSDRIVVMQNGCIEQFDTPHNIYEKPLTTFVAGFIGHCNLRPVKRIEQKNDFMTIEDPILGLVQARVFEECIFDPADKTVTLAIRPEKVRIGPSAEECPSQVHGTLKYAGYGGSIIRYVVSIGENDEMIVESGMQLAAEVGDQVTIGWYPDDVNVLPSAPEQRKELNGMLP
jgi:spermidine/putrescine ABC transporter ATP-binding subunit